MIAVIFEVEMPDESRDAYLEMAAALKPRLADMDGFISIERFESLTTPGKLLSLSFWRVGSVGRMAQSGGASAGAGGGTSARLFGLPAADRGGHAGLWYGQARRSSR